MAVAKNDETVVAPSDEIVSFEVTQVLGSIDVYTGYAPLIKGAPKEAPEVVAFKLVLDNDTAGIYEFVVPGRYGGQPTPFRIEMGKVR